MKTASFGILSITIPDSMLYANK